MIFTGIEDLREKREEISKQLREEEAEKAKITQDLQVLTKRLNQVNESIARKVGEIWTLMCSRQVCVEQGYTMLKCRLPVEARLSALQ